MKGLDLSEAFYTDILAPLITRRFPRLAERYSAGLIGYGSDVLGYDDEFSHDHEWGPRGQVWLSPADYRYYGSRLSRALDDTIPTDYQGAPARFVTDDAIHCRVPAPAGVRGMHLVEITTLPLYLHRMLGLRKLPPTTPEWLCLPEQKLLEFTRGKIFYDPTAQLTQARANLAYLPDEVWRFKLRYAWESADEIFDVVMLNAARGDLLGARLALSHLARRIIRLVFLLNRRYCPATPKWLAREFSCLPRLAPKAGPQLEACLSCTNPLHSRLILEEIFIDLLVEHNRQEITLAVSFSGASPYSRGLVSFSLRPVANALEDSLPPILRSIEIHGGLDQWSTNEDVLIWPHLYGKFRKILTPSGS